jgi:glutathione S-transferase
VSTPLRLYTFTISHFSEKVRWVLSHERIEFVEVPWVPALHVVSARTMGGATTVPIVEAGRERVQDSTAIVEWLDEHRGPLSLLPRGPMRDEAMALEARFDEVGGEVIRVAYDHAFRDPDAVIRLWTIDATRGQALAVRMGFPIFQLAFRARVGMGPKQIAHAREVIDAGLGLVEERTRDGARHLVGEQLTIADVTAAALLAPLACPEEHAVYGSARFRELVAPVVEPWKDRPALAWVRETYRAHRRKWRRAREVREILAR